MNVQSILFYALTVAEVPMKRAYISRILYICDMEHQMLHGSEPIIKDWILKGVKAGMSSKGVEKGINTLLEKGLISSPVKGVFVAKVDGRSVAPILGEFRYSIDQYFKSHLKRGLIGAHPKSLDVHTARLHKALGRQLTVLELANVMEEDRREKAIRNWPKS